MDNIKIREKGLYTDYHPDTTHRDVIYFATDTHQILLNGENYGSNTIKEIDVIVYDNQELEQQAIINLEQIRELEDGEFIQANITYRAPNILTTELPSDQHITAKGVFYSELTSISSNAIHPWQPLGEIQLESDDILNTTKLIIIPIENNSTDSFNCIVLHINSNCGLCVIDNIPQKDLSNVYIIKNWNNLLRTVEPGSQMLFLDTVNGSVIPGRAAIYTCYYNKGYSLFKLDTSSSDFSPPLVASYIKVSSNGYVEVSNDNTSPYFHVTQTDNPHQVTAEQVGLGNVNNTSDENKPISNATQQALDNKVDKVDGKELSDTNFTQEEKDKLAGIEDGAQVNTVLSVAGKTGEVLLSKSDVGLSNVTNDAQLKRSELGQPDGVAALNSNGYINFSDLHLSNSLGSLYLVPSDDTEDYTNRDNASPSLTWTSYQQYKKPTIYLPVFTGEGIAHNPKSYLVVTERGLASREKILQDQVDSLRENLRSFLEDSDVADSTINKWKELEQFLNGITDTQTLTGVIQSAIAANNATLQAQLQEMQSKINTVWANYVSAQDI